MQPTLPTLTDNLTLKKPIPSIPNSLSFVYVTINRKHLSYQTPDTLFSSNSYREALAKGSYSENFVEGVIEGLANSSLYESQTPK